jgi:sn-glycerol 3-phosphate transport system permease protein
MIDTYFALVLPFTVSSLGVFLIRQAFMSIHDDYIDAAKLDGAGTLSIIFKLLVPMSKGTLIAFSLFSIIYHWNNYFWPLVMTSRDEARTLPVGIAMLREQGTGARWHIIMAGNMFSVIPIFLIFLFAQKAIMKSFAMTGLKG